MQLGGMRLGVPTQGERRSDQCARDIGTGAERGIADDVEIAESGKTERFTDAVPTGTLEVEEKLHSSSEPQAAVHGGHGRSRALANRTQAVRAGVDGIEGPMPLINHVQLP